MTSEQENNAAFPQPWGPQTGWRWWAGRGAKHRQPFYHGSLSLQATQLPITFIMWEEGEVGGSKGEEKKAEDRYHIPLRARSVQSDWSLSCLPLVASWTKHRPVDSLRTLLL